MLDEHYPGDLAQLQKEFEMEKSDEAMPVDNQANGQAIDSSQFLI